MKRLDHKICLITGAAQGIGQAIAELFHQEGGTILVSDIKDKIGKQLTKTIGNNAEYLHLDVKKEADWQEATAHILEKYRRLDVLVNKT